MGFPEQYRVQYISLVNVGRTLHREHNAVLGAGKLLFLCLPCGLRAGTGTGTCAFLAAAGQVAAGVFD